MKNLLFNVSATNPTIFALIALLVAGVALVYPKTLFDILGFGLVAIVLFTQWLRKPSLPTS